MLLLHRWRQVLERHADARALTVPATGEAWTFAQLDAAARSMKLPEVPFMFASGLGSAFVIQVLKAWQSGRTLCPLEIGQAAPIVPALPGDIAHLKTTSATTGNAKFVMFRAEQLAADADNIVATMGLRRDWTNLGAISLAHSYGFSNLVLPLLLHGIPLVLTLSPLPEAIRMAMGSSVEFTLPGVPALWKMWLDAGVLNHQIRLAISAGAPLSLELERAVYERHGIKLHTFYGSTECGGIAYDRTETPRTDAGFVGCPMHSVSLGVGVQGCLEVRGAAVGVGYWPETMESLTGGVFATSDIAELKDGCVFLRGRASEMINVAGRKLHPELVEQAIERHPSVNRCAVFGVADSERGERVVAVVNCTLDCNEETLRIHAQQLLHPWQVPKEWWLTQELTCDSRGKLSRLQWRERYVANRAIQHR
jgi:long-chain acyl-CoA synthetase